MSNTNGISHRNYFADDEHIPQDYYYGDTTDLVLSYPNGREKIQFNWYVNPDSLIQYFTYCKCFNIKNNDIVSIYLNEIRSGDACPHGFTRGEIKPKENKYSCFLMPLDNKRRTIYRYIRYYFTFCKDIDGQEEKYEKHIDLTGENSYYLK